MKEYKRLTDKKIDIDSLSDKAKSRISDTYLKYAKINNALWELENKIENGTLKFIPCKVGDKVYYETFINNGSQSVGVQPHEVKSIYTSIVTSNFSGYDNTIVELDEVGKTVFLTEAEAKLKELKGEV